MENRIRHFFENNNELTFFKIVDADGNTIEKYEGEAEEIAETVVNDVQTLEAGKYQVWGGKSNTINKMTAKKLHITIAETIQNKSINRPQKMAGFYSKEDIENAYNQGVKDARINTLELQVKKLEERFEKLIVLVSEWKDEVDGKEDNDLLSKLVDGASKVSEVKDVLGNFNM